MPVTVLLRYSYPKVPGDSPWSVADATGPASYTPITTGSPPTGGQLVTAADFGNLEELDWVGSTGSDDGQYAINVIPAPFATGSALNSVLLQWIVAATGAEVAAAVNLSARTVRLLAIGR